MFIKGARIRAQLFFLATFTVQKFLGLPVLNEVWHETLETARVRCVRFGAIHVIRGKR